MSVRRESMRSVSPERLLASGEIITLNSPAPDINLACPSPFTNIQFPALLTFLTFCYSGARRDRRSSSRSAGSQMLRKISAPCAYLARFIELLSNQSQTQGCVLPGQGSSPSSHRALFHHTRIFHTTGMGHARAGGREHSHSHQH